jgi:hypothetical protein
LEGFHPWAIASMKLCWALDVLGIGYFLSRARS